MLQRYFSSSMDRKYLKISLPAAMEGVFMILLSNVDLIMVGVLGASAIAAVSIFTQPRMMLLTVARSLAAAVTLLTAEYFGAGRKMRAGKVLRQSLFLGAIVMLIFHIAFFAYLPELLIWMGAEEYYLQLALDYAWIALTAVYMTSLTAILQAIQLGFGETAVVLKTNLQGNVINVIVNALLIFGLGPFPEMGVRGAAIGTLVGTLYTFGFASWQLKQAGIMLPGGFIPTRLYFREFIPIFGSIFSEQGFERIGMVIYTRMVAELGMIPYAIHAICMNFCDFYYCFAGGLGKGSTVIAGHAKGRKDMVEWKTLLAVSIKWSAIFSMVSFVLTACFREEIFSLYTSDASLLPLGSLVMFIVAMVSFPEAQQMVCAGILRGSGKSAHVAIYSFVSITVLRPIITAFFLYYLEMGLVGAWIALALDQSTRAICASFLLWRLQKTEKWCLETVEGT